MHWVRAVRRGSRVVIERWRAPDTIRREVLLSKWREFASIHMKITMLLALESSRASCDIRRQVAQGLSADAAVRSFEPRHWPDVRSHARVASGESTTTHLAFVPRARRTMPRSSKCGSTLATPAKKRLITAWAGSSDLNFEVSAIASNIACSVKSIRLVQDRTPYLHRCFASTTQASKIIAW